MRSLRFGRMTTTIAAFLVVGTAALAPTRTTAEGGARSSSAASKSGLARMSTADRLWEMEQIKQLKARYFRFLDTKRWKEFRSLLTDDFVWYFFEGDGNKVKHPSPEALVKFLSATHDEARAISAHQGKMPEIELTSDRTARGIWEMSDWVDYPQKQAFQGFGYYYETYEKGNDGRWRIKSVRLVRLRVDQVAPSQEPNKEYPRGSAPWWPEVR